MAIAQISGQPNLMARVLAGRGVELEEVARYLDPTLRDSMPDPFTMRDMEPAVQRLAQAVRRGEKIAIFGDYDVDRGTQCGAAERNISAIAVVDKLHIPDRAIEGYGPNVEAMRAFAAKRAELVVTVDCGIVSHEPFAEARRLGLEVLVFDHHQAPELLPDALALVDPNRQDDLSGLGYLRGGSSTWPWSRSAERCARAASGAGARRLI